MIFAFVVVLIAFALFLYVLGLDIPGTWKFAVSVAEMIVVGQVLSMKYNLGASWGLILFRTKKDWTLSRHWQNMKNSGVFSQKLEP